MKKKYWNYASFLILGVFLVSFFILAMIGVAIQENYVNLVFLLLFLFVLGIGIAEMFGKITQKSVKSKLNLPLIFVMAVSAVLTWFLNNNLSMGLVISSALVALLGYFIPLIWKSEFTSKLPVAIYCASFVGMTSGLVLDYWFLVAFAGLLCGFLFVYTKNVFAGVGGMLGAIACLSVSITMILINLLTIFVGWII